MRPSQVVTRDQLVGWFKPELIERSNEVVTGLVVMLFFTKSAKIAEAIKEIARLGLAGSDWKTRGLEIGEHIPFLELEKLKSRATTFCDGGFKPTLGRAKYL